MLDDADVLVYAYGSVSRAVKEAIIKLREQGIKAGLFRPISIWPSPAKAIKSAAEKFADKPILVTEMNMGQYVEEIERLTKRDDLHTLFKANGRPISPAEIMAKIKEMV